MFITFLFISSFLIPTCNVFAYDNDFYSANDILFYTPDDTACSETSTNTGTITGSENLETILKFLTGKGLSLAAAAGIAGNLFQESGYYPAKIQNSSTFATDSYAPVNGVGFGIAQWTFTSRQLPLTDMAKTQGKSIIDINLQLDFMWAELTSSYKPVLEYLSAIKSNTPINSTSAPMAAAIIFHGRTDKIANDPTQEIKDLTASSIGFHSGYEGSADSTATLINNRGKTAESVFNTYNGKIADGTGVTDITIETTSSYSTTSGCGSPSGDATWPNNVEAYGDGWTLKDSVDYSTIACADGSTDKGTITHETRDFIIRLCQTDVGQVSSLISGKVLAIISAAKQDGVTLTGGGFRTYTEQRDLYNERCTVVNSDGIRSDVTCSIQTAKPGSSEHEKGLAIDFVLDSANTVSSWLIANGSKYGFINLPSEAWHYSMSGH